MQKYNIAIGRSKCDTRWQNKQVTWQTFLDKIRNTHRTSETIGVYLKATSARQDDIKDIGGFVGGHLSGGRRLASAIVSRSMLTFDADEAELDFWERFTMQYGCKAALYSTHKHTEDAPRYRLIIPLTREVFPDEYAAIMRRMAGDTGIDQYDHTCYQPERLMYWPSTSKDGVYDFREQDGEVLNPDDILATYGNWQDVSEWPTGIRENKIRLKDAKKQGEPNEKPGLIGAFNRAYTISEVIDKYLSDVYEKCDADDRYTYIEGSTAAGVIVYDDKYTFSHHSTDPTSGQLCNAFDLVRLHKYSLLDKTDEDIPINKRPSYLAMCDFVSTDQVVKRQLGEAKLTAAKEAFSDIAEAMEVGAKSSMVPKGKNGQKPNLPKDEEIADDTAWLDLMDVDRKGNYLGTINNIALILEHDPVFRNNLAFDEFKQQGIFRRNLPWRKLNGKDVLTDKDMANIENYIEKVYKLTTGSKLAKGLLVVLEKASFHPVVSYLKSLEWDGTPRVDNLLIKYLGAADTEYVRTVTRKALAACVARVMQPGIKFDYVLTLVGEEGQGKSALWDRLGGKWFSDTFNMHMLQTKEAYEQIQGVWIIEIGELAGMAKAEVERVKGFISARQDNYRSPYGHNTEQRLRQCVFFASTNTSDFLKSQTGNRRFWPVATFEREPIASVYEMDKEIVDQVWAEALELYANDEPLYLDKELSAEAKLVQEDYTQENPLVESIEHFVSMRIPPNWYDLDYYEKLDFINSYDKQDQSELVERDRVCKYEIWELVIQGKGTITLMAWQQIKQAMDKLKGWVKVKEQQRYGHYPRHKGGYFKEITLQSLIG